MKSNILFAVFSLGLILAAISMLTLNVVLLGISELIVVISTALLIRINLKVP